jgi:leucyl-tRNA synthetase
MLVDQNIVVCLIYFRFITMFLYDIGFIDFEEPVIKLIHQG